MPASFTFTPAIAGTTNATIDNTGTIKATVTGAGNALRLLNTGTTTAFVTIDSTGTLTASKTTSMPIVNGAAPEVISIPATGTVYVTGITASGTTALYATRGNAV
jgi:hypothetical protein